MLSFPFWKVDLALGWGGGGWGWRDDNGGAYSHTHPKEVKWLESLTWDDGHQLHLADKGDL